MSAWTDIVDGIGGTRQDLAAGTMLFRAGDEARALFHVEQGRVGLFRDGQRVHLAPAGSLVSEEALFSPHHTSDALAERPTRLRVLPKATVLLFLRAHPDLNLAFSAHLAEELRRQRELAGILRLPQARSRVLAWLAGLEAVDGVIALSRPLVEVAAEIGLSHEALYRTIAALVAEGKLERPGRRSFRLVG